MAIKVKLFNKTIKKESADNFLILEAGTNHYELGDCFGISHMEAGREMISAAASTGADAIKFQIYKADTLIHKKANDYNYILRHSTMEYIDYLDLMKHAKKEKIHFMATLFDEEGLEMFGNKLEVFKVASPDITYKPLLKKINEYGKPVLLSIGASNIDEIFSALNLLKNCPVIIMYCKAIYPLPDEKHNLGVIRELNKLFPKNVIGFSTHGDQINIVPALHLGANVLEVHFKTSDSIYGNDYKISTMPQRAENLKNALNYFKTIYGNDIIKVEPEEEPVRLNGRRRHYEINGRTKFLRPFND